LISTVPALPTFTDASMTKEAAIVPSAVRMRLSAKCGEFEQWLAREIVAPYLCSLQRQTRDGWQLAMQWRGLIAHLRAVRLVRIAAHAASADARQGS
jgi:hypothetical protein